MEACFTDSECAVVFETFQIQISIQKLVSFRLATWSWKNLPTSPTTDGQSSKLSLTSQLKMIRFQLRVVVPSGDPSCDLGTTSTGSADPSLAIVVAHQTTAQVISPSPSPTCLVAAVGEIKPLNIYLGDSLTTLIARPNPNFNPSTFNPTQALRSRMSRRIHRTILPDVPDPYRELLTPIHEEESLTLGDVGIDDPWPLDPTDNRQVRKNETRIHSAAVQNLPFPVLHRDFAYIMDGTVDARRYIAHSVTTSTGGKWLGDEGPKSRFVADHDAKVDTVEDDKEAGQEDISRRGKEEDERSIGENKDTAKC
ncbi:hypothetical protein M231_04070 [Tremella mesenterica]|uniref:Uncharacterized protein n=1 Tax=Tremella mesenterica TaxID=5217 RepID=A0A4Q1BLJ2_TREME|nr:hypothetical protein M231_04070 [Tremella mesenterica]